mmetsp:Transcript_9660/g.19350  ORF Transcript_9660/g.19350 Transcript_9660/m.19350 type:complete len:398 (+) Transcript_9660:117-1310(+)|eukprot:CAMPEP_0181330560 /NCGR_PEP_ID=MMETSP1101-20121128/23968_1 /TAXON_ID=46948 /ORGANISM="Rhodomonas abbreviata, Strain Caron Lab Isolate" /LENGTH=397 /DNA_ID=CAMNT_0023439831 /DNA_START=106 /DNA_END=1299 /DNA_ORIENTATION=+
MFWSKILVSGARVRPNFVSITRRSVNWDRLGPRTSDSWSKYKGVAYIGLGTATAVVAVAVLPPFKGTREGFNAAVSGPRQPCNPLWSWLFGAIGGYAAFQGTIANITKIGRDYPVLAGLRTPWALCGGVMGSSLCYHLTPVIMESTTKFSHIIAFTLDGLVADIVGRAEGQKPAWEKPDWGLGGKYEHVTSEDRELDRRMKETIQKTSGRPQTPPPPERGATLPPSERDASSVEGEEVKKEIRWMCAQLMQLRNQEKAIRHTVRVASGAAREYLQAESRPKLGRIAREKQMLKDSARQLYNVSLGKRTEQVVVEAARDLQILRFKQLALAREMYEGCRAERKNAIMSEISALDHEKAKLKHHVNKSYGIKISRKCHNVMRWKDAASTGKMRATSWDA